MRQLSQLHQRARQIVGPVQREVADDEIERGGREGQHLGLGHGPGRWRPARAGQGRIARHQALDAAASGQRPSQRAETASEIERHAESGD